MNGIEIKVFVSKRMLERSQHQKSVLGLISSEAQKQRMMEEQRKDQLHIFGENITETKTAILKICPGFQSE
jgi:hypothetical protein